MLLHCMCKIHWHFHFIFIFQVSAYGIECRVNAIYLLDLPSIEIFHAPSHFELDATEIEVSQ